MQGNKQAYSYIRVEPGMARAVHTAAEHRLLRSRATHRHAGTNERKVVAGEKDNADFKLIREPERRK